MFLGNTAARANLSLGVSSSTQDEQSLSLDQKNYISDIKRITDSIDLIVKIQEILTGQVRDFVQLKVLLEELACNCQQITHNDKDGNSIRNKYGHYNYSSSRENEAFVNFDELAQIVNILSDSEISRYFLEILSAPKLGFAEQLNILRENLRAILCKEKSNAELIEGVSQQCPEVKKQEIHELERIKDLQLLITAYADYFYLKNILELVNPELYKTHFEVVEKIGDLDKEKLYIISRLLTLLGEASKNISEFVKSRLPIPFHELCKIRDYIGHIVSLKSNADLGSILLKVVANSAGLPTMFEPLQKYLKEMEKIVTYPTMQTLGNTDNKGGEEETKRAEQLWMNIINYIENGREKGQHLILSGEIAVLKTGLSRLKQNLKNKKEVKIEPNEDKLEKKKTRLKKKQKELEEKVEQGALTPQEDEVLKNITKELKEMENSEVSIPKNEPGKSVDDIDSEYKAARKKLEEKQQQYLSSYHVAVLIELYNILLKCVSDHSIEVQSTAEDKLKNMFASLVEELKYLSTLYYTRIVGLSRYYAVEHCISIIGQKIRDLNYKKCEPLLNLTIIDAFRETRLARNSIIMHDSVTNHTDAAWQLATNIAMPLVRDLGAINDILQSPILQLERELSEKGIEWFLKTSISSTLMQAATDIGYAYWRLRKFEQAKEYFNMALDYGSAEFCAEICGIKVDETKILTFYDETTAFYQFVMLDNLLNVLLELAQYQEANDCCEKLKILCHNYPELMKNPKYHDNWMIHYAIVLFNRGMVDEAEEQFELLFLHHDSYIKIASIINAASCYISRGTQAQRRKEFNKLAVSTLQKIKLHDITDIRAKLNYLQILSYATRNLADEENSLGSIENILNALTLAKNALFYCDTAQAILIENQAAIRTEHGDEYRVLNEKLKANRRDIIELYCIIENNLGICYRNSEEGKESIVHLKSALKMQKEIGLSPACTLVHLSQSYYAIREYANSVEHGKEVLKLDKISPVLTGRAQAQIGFAYEAQGDYDNALNYLNAASQSFAKCTKEDDIGPDLKLVKEAIKELENYLLHPIVKTNF